VARTYAGILGPLALLIALAHGLVHAAEPETILLVGWCSLLVFAVVGYLVGWIAGRTVDESVGATIQAELAQEPSPENPQPPPSAS
jgi:hypothetical protein